MMHCDDYSPLASRKGLLINFGKTKVSASVSLCTDIVVLICSLLEADIWKASTMLTLRNGTLPGRHSPTYWYVYFCPHIYPTEPKLSSSMQILPSDISKRFKLASSVAICASSETGRANTISEASARPSILGKTALRTPVLHLNWLPLVWVGLALRQWRLRRMLP